MENLDRDHAGHSRKPLGNAGYPCSQYYYPHYAPGWNVSYYSGPSRPGHSSQEGNARNESDTQDTLGDL